MKYKIKAPKYFLEHREKGDVYMKEMAEMLDVSFEWLVKKIESKDRMGLKTLIFEKSKYWNKEKSQRMKILSDLSADHSSLAWNLLKYNSKMARESEIMEYDFRNQIIILKSGIFKGLIKGLNREVEKIIAHLR